MAQDTATEHETVNECISSTSRVEWTMEWENAGDGEAIILTGQCEECGREIGELFSRDGFVELNEDHDIIDYGY